MTRASHRAAMLAILLVVGLVLSHSGNAVARWQEVQQVVGPRAGLSAYAVDISSPEEQGPVWNYPAIMIANTSSQRTVVQLQRLLVNMSAHSAPLGRDSYVRYRIGMSGCRILGANVWPTTSNGWVYHTLSDGDYFTAPDNIQFTVAPRSTQWLCPEVALQERSDTPDDIDLLHRRYAGMGFKLTTTFSWRTESPASWVTNQQIETTYRIRFPDISMTAPNCSATINLAYTDLAWRWPRDSTAAETPAVHHWEAYFRPTGSDDWTKVSGRAAGSSFYDRLYGAWDGNMSSRDRSLWLHHHAFGEETWSGTMRLRAVLDPGRDSWVQSSFEVELSYPGSGQIQCGRVVPIEPQSSNLP